MATHKAKPGTDKVKLAAMAGNLPRDKKAEAQHTRKSKPPRKGEGK